MKLENICIKGFNTKLNSAIYPDIMRTGNSNTDKGYNDIAIKNNYELKPNEVQSGYVYFKKDEIVNELYFTDGTHSCFLQIPNIETSINRNSENTKLSTKAELQEYLEKNYSTLSTSMGSTSFTYIIYENNDVFTEYDYWIQVRFDSTFFYNLQYSINYTNEQKAKTKQELKDFQEKLAKDIIAKMPDKKLYGGYYDSWYKYPNLKIDLQTQRYYSWTNYEVPDYLSVKLEDRYASTKPSTFRWYPVIDDEL